MRGTVGGGGYEKITTNNDILLSNSSLYVFRAEEKQDLDLHSLLY